MTGFGEAKGGKAPLVWNVEIRSWNHRFFECSARLPQVLNGFEDRIRDFIHGRIKRGKIAVSISLRTGELKNQVGLDAEKIDFYFRAIKRIQKRYRLGEALSINTLLAIPNIFTTGSKEELGEADWNRLNRVMEQAVGQLLNSKTKEGRALSLDLKGRLRRIVKSLSRITQLERKISQKRFVRLQERVSKLTEGLLVDSKRLEQEIAFLADRSDITEELVRARHHAATFEKTFSESGEVGKRLDFLSQEIHREVNTIGSKAQDSSVSDEVVRIKSELEKIREQIQNVE